MVFNLSQGRIMGLGILVSHSGPNLPLQPSFAVTYLLHMPSAAFEHTYLPVILEEKWMIGREPNCSHTAPFTTSQTSAPFQPLAPVGLP